MLKMLNRNQHMINYSKMQNMAQLLQVKKNFYLYNSIVEYLFIKNKQLNFKSLLNF